MEGAEFLQFVWGHQPEGYAVLVHRDESGKWRESSFYYKGQQLSLIVPSGGDLYWCPNLFSQPERKKEYCLPSRVMYQDLDEAHPNECPLKPELWWETSRGRYQAAWILDEFMEPDEFSSYNKALNRACHADPGTWNLTRLLRVPGSWNEKRGCQVGRAYKRLELVA